MVAVSAWLAAAALVYGPVLTKLVHDWRGDPTYSHGFLVPPIALFLVWLQRDRLRHAPAQPSRIGLVLLASGLALFVLGSLGAELFLTRISIVFVLAGTVAFVWGRRHLQLLAFPITFLVFMIPLPAIVFDRLSVSLQLVASGLGERLLQAVDVPVLRDGNILVLANATLEVTDACSGIRSLVALVMMTSLVANFVEPSVWRRTLLTAAAVPVAVVLNGGRIAITGVATEWLGPALADGFLHEVVGWAVFVGALASVWALHTATRSRGLTAVEMTA